jgi:hypothetical protein
MSTLQVIVLGTGARRAAVASDDVSKRLRSSRTQPKPPSAAALHIEPQTKHVGDTNKTPP